MTHSIGKDVLLVEVPEAVIDSFKMSTCLRALCFYDIANGYTIPDCIILPPGNWQYITTSDEITEEQCKEIVECYGFDIYKSYEPDINDYEDSALNSFHSLLRSLNLKRVAVLKKNQE